MVGFYGISTIIGDSMPNPVFTYLLNIKKTPAIGLMSRAFANGSGDRGSIPQIQKMAFDAALINTQHYKVRIKGKVEQFRK